MQLHVVGGFLGSGKTTAIIAAARHLIREGKKVGVVTNDRGSHLVDTAFFQNSNISTVEIALLNRWDRAAIWLRLLLSRCSI